MKDCSQQFGTNFLQRSVQQSSWYLVLRCMALRERQLTRHCNRIAIVRSAEKNRITIRPSEQVTVRGYVDKSQPYHQTCALLQPHPQVTVDLDLNPSLISYRHQLTEPVEVSFSNLSTHTVTINPKTVLCEVQPVDITSLEDVPASVRDSLLSQIDLDSDRLSPEQEAEVKRLLMDFESIFSKHMEDIGFSARVRHRVDLNDEQPFKQRHRMIPPSMLDEVRSHIQQLLASGTSGSLTVPGHPTLYLHDARMDAFDCAQIFVN